MEKEDTSKFANIPKKGPKNYFSGKTKKILF